MTKKIQVLDPMSFYPEPTPEEVNGPPKCEWCQDRKVIYGESPNKPQGETCPMCE